MDPITIATAAASLAGAVLAASLKIKNTVDHLEHAPQSVCDIADEVYAVQYALSQVEGVVRRDPNVIDRLALEDVFALAVKGCHATLQSIHKEYEDLFAKSDWKTRILVLWKDGEMTRLLARLDRKKATLTLLTQTLNLRSTQDIKELLVQNQSTLVAARQDSFDVVPNKSSPRARVSDPLEDGDVDSGGYGDNESVLSTTEFDFDYDLINTRTYRRALARAQAASKGPKQAAVNVDKPLPEVAEEDSPTSLQPIPEAKAGDVTEPIDLSGDTVTSQFSLSRATTLQAEFDAPELGISRSTSSLNRVEKLAEKELDFEGGGHNSRRTWSSEGPTDEKESKFSNPKKKHRNGPKFRLHESDSDEKSRRRRPHGRPSLSKRRSESTLVSTPSQSSASEVVSPENQGRGDVFDKLSGDPESVFDRHRALHRCGRKPDARHRPRGGWSGSEEGGLKLPTMSQGLRELHSKGFSDTAEKMEGAMRQLKLSDHAAMRRERIRRRQLARTNSDITTEIGQR